MPDESFRPDDIVKTCPKLESGLNLAIEGLRACTRGALLPPVFCRTEDILHGHVNKDFIAEKRRQQLRMLNDDHSETDCKRCLMVRRRRYGDIDFTRLGHIDLQHYSACNLRCRYCNYTREDVHCAPQYDALSILRSFSANDIEWDAHVDFAGGEPSLLKNLDDYFAFFRELRIRIFMHTNSVRYRQAIYNGLAEGSISCVVTSVDAGTPSTFRALRGRDHYFDVLENLTRYAAAASRGGSVLAAKYIFADTNCGDDDIGGFAYAMLAIRPQKVWLTLDFTPLYLRQHEHDYSKQVEAYATLYLLLKKHGLEAFHYYREAIATVSKDGREVMNRILAAIARKGHDVPRDVNVLLPDFRKPSPASTSATNPPHFQLAPLRLLAPGKPEEGLSLAGKRLLVVPSTPRAGALLSDPDVQRADWIGFIDRDPVLKGKLLEGKTIYGYESIASLSPDVILVVPPEKHREDILAAVARHARPGTQVAELAPDCQ